MTISSPSFQSEDLAGPTRASLDDAIGRGVGGLLGLQREDGHWAFILEADATIPAEYILLKHFLGVVDREKEALLATYIRSIQSKVHDGWPLWHDGPLNISASVKAYFALKAAGDDPDAPHMARARAAILAAAPGAIEIGDRRKAIHEAVAMLHAGDTLIVAGKGHEEGQTIGSETLHFSDHEEVRAALRERAA